MEISEPWGDLGEKDLHNGDLGEKDLHNGGRLEIHISLKKDLGGA